MMFLTQIWVGVCYQQNISHSLPSLSGIKCLFVLYDAWGPDPVVTIRGVIAGLFWPLIQEQLSEATPESSVSVETVDKGLQDGEAASKVRDEFFNIFTSANEENAVLCFIFVCFFMNLRTSYLSFFFFLEAKVIRNNVRDCGWRCFQTSVGKGVFPCYTCTVNVQNNSKCIS